MNKVDFFKNNMEQNRHCDTHLQVDDILLFQLPVSSSSHLHGVPFGHRHFTEPPSTTSIRSPPLPKLQPLASVTVDFLTFCTVDMAFMFSLRAGIVFFCDNCLERSVCCSRALDDELRLSPLSPNGLMSASCGNRHKNIPPSTLVLTTNRPSGLTFTLVTTPACPTPTCVGIPSLYSHTFTN